jgi:hypothetical protein
MLRSSRGYFQADAKSPGSFNLASQSLHLQTRLCGKLRSARAVVLLVRAPRSCRSLTANLAVEAVAMKPLATEASGLTGIR